MTTQSLKVIFNNSKNCFISLPRQFSHVFKRQNSAPIAIFRLSWRSIQNQELVTAYAGWSWSVCTNGCIELPVTFASCLQLEEYTMVQVEHIPEAMNDMITNGTDTITSSSSSTTTTTGQQSNNKVGTTKDLQVFVEPNTVNDSEILEYNQTSIEQQLMNQIRVVYPGLVFPLWIHSNVCIHVRVVSCGDNDETKSLPSTVVLLKEGTELIVATKQRSNSAEETEQTTDSAAQNKNKSWRRVKILLLEQEPDSRTIHISSSLASEMGFEDGDVVQLLNILRVRITPSAEEQQKQQQDQGMMQQLKEFEEKKERRSVYARVSIASDLSSNEGNMIRLGLHLKQQLGAVVFSTIYLRYCDHVSSHSYISTLYAREILNERGDDYGDSNEEQGLNPVHFQQMLKDWIKQQQQQQGEIDIVSPVPLCQHNIIQLSDGRKCLMSINEPIRLDETSNAFVNFVNMSSSENLYLFDESVQLMQEDASKACIYTWGDSVEVKLCEDAYFDFPQFQEEESTESLSESAKRCVDRMKTQFSPYRNLRQHYSYHYASTPHLTITGQAGMGKSHFAQSLAKYSNVYIVNVSCTSMAGDRTDTITMKLRSYFSEAMSHSPSVIIMDDLDVLCPFEQEEAMPDPNVKVLSTIFIDLMSKLTRYAVSTNTSDPFEKTVAVIATSKSTDTLNKKIQASNIFEANIHMSVPDRKQRAKIFKSIMERPSIYPYTISEDSMDKIVTKTENYSPGDIENIILKMINTCMRRRLQEQNYTLGDSETIELTLEDFEVASQDFVTKSIEGIKLVKSSTKFEDIGGLEEVKQILRETFEFPTKYAKYFENSPIKLRSGLLLYGPPGCGKTFLANAVAGECGLNFISVKGPELLNKYIGASEQAVRDVFRQADAAKPCIIFFDEFDSIAAKRGHDNTGVTDRVVNQFLTQLDGVESRQGVYVLAATSRPDLIDAALLRPGRLDKSIMCPLPDSHEREHILKAHTRDYHLAEDVSLAEIAEMTEYYSGADLQGLVYTASLISAREHEEERREQLKDMEQAISPNTLFRVVAKNKSKRKGKGKASSEGGPSSFAAQQQVSEQLNQQMESIFHNLKSRETAGMAEDQEAEEESIVIISREHLIKAMSQTMPSLNANERDKYDYIYEGFVNPSSVERQFEQRVTLA